jgi:hypothetical protein
MKSHLLVALCAASFGVTSAAQPRDALFDDGWRFFRGDDYSTTTCSRLTFPKNLGNVQVLGLTYEAQAVTQDECQQVCCLRQGCELWQFCPESAPCNSTKGCWIGKMGNLHQGATGWIGRARSSAPEPVCTSQFCKPAFDDSTWEKVNLPHDWSALDLLPRQDDKSTPTLGLRYGPWRFHSGDGAFSLPTFDDSHWQHVKGGEDWRVHSN